MFPVADPEARGDRNPPGTGRRLDNPALAEKCVIRELLVRVPSLDLFAGSTDLRIPVVRTYTTPQPNSPS